MKITRRKLIQGGALTGAALAMPQPFHRALLGPRTAHASVVDPILVVVQLEGGNDYLNTVIPVDDQPGAAQRTAYDAVRPTIGIPVNDLGPTTIGADPVKGNTLALHPSMPEMKTLFDGGQLALIQGVAYDNQSLSHFRSEDIWFSAEPNQIFSSGWFGRYLDSYYSPSDLVTADIDAGMSKMFVCPGGCNVLAIKKLSKFVLPQDSQYPDVAASRLALETAYDVEADPLVTSGLQNEIGVSGQVLIGAVDDYGAITTNWGSNLSGVSGSLSKRLLEVSSIIRHDAVSGAPVGARYFHVRLGGFDTHSNQPTRHASLLQQVSQSLAAFYQDLQDINAAAGSNVSDRVLTLTFSEFGRRVAENGALGTDHGQASVMFAMGDSVNGDIYGELPDIATTNSKGNLPHHTDFRQVYATAIDWMQGPGAHNALLPGGPYTTIPFI